MSVTSPTYQELLAENIVVKEENNRLKQQIEWFRKQLFGSKSERVMSDNPQQLILFPEMNRQTLTR